MFPETQYAHDPRVVAALPVAARARFLSRVYAHLFGALVGFTLIEIALFASGAAYAIAESMLGVSWLLVLGGFVVVSMLATRAAHTSTNRLAQYAALAAFVVGEALIFVPLLVIAELRAGGGVIASAGFVSLAGFAGLTFVGLFSRKDFSFLRSLLMWGGVGALILIVAAVLFGFQLGVIFSVAMVVLAGAAILYDTQKILHEYPEDRYVGASLQLFASVAMLFWYVLRIFMSARD
jgi:FtsH-binding integral membrane protein